MIRSSFPVIAVLGLCLAVSHPAFAAADVPIITVGLERARIYTDQEAILNVVVSYPGDGRTLAVGGPELLALDALEVVGRSTTTETFREGGGRRTEIRHRMVLVPRRAGTVSLDSVLVTWADPLSGEPQTSVFRAGTIEIRNRPPGVTFLMRHWRRTLAGGALLAAGAAVLVWLIRRRRPVAEESGLSPDEALEQDWHRLRVLARQGSLGPFSEETSRSVREFVKGRFGIPAAHLPTAAIVDALEGRNAPSVVVGAVRKTLTFVDDMRFGLWVPTHAELDSILGEIQTLWSSGQRNRETEKRRNGSRKKAF